MINFILTSIQGLVNLLFLVAIVGTLVVLVDICQSVEKTVRRGLSVG